MALILLVEDDVLLCSTLARAMSKILEVEVHSASTFADAVALVRAEPPDLIISDVDLPDGLGVELLSVIADLELEVPVVFMSAYLREYGRTIPTGDSITVLEKPVSFATLREIIAQKVGSEGDEEQVQAPFTVLDYARLAVSGSYSLVVHVDAQGADAGVVYIREGEIWEAIDGRGNGGADTFVRLCALRTAPVRCRRLVEAVPRRTVFEPWPKLARRAHAAAGMLAEPSGPPRQAPDRAEVVVEKRSAPGEVSTRPPSVAATVPAKSTEEALHDALRDEATEALLIKDHETALRAFRDANAIFPNDPTVQANIHRLERICGEGSRS